MIPFYRNIMIISDLEGSSGCGNYRSSAFMTREWIDACLAMTKDVDAVARALFLAGVKRVVVKDFHRTAYNLLPEYLDGRVKLVSGYKKGPVPGIGETENAEAVMFLGMHAASGSSGFLAHTLTSRLSRLKANGRLLSEVELFSASVAPFDIVPVFFSGCPVACEQAKSAIPGIDVYPAEKNETGETENPEKWREGLAKAAAASLENRRTSPHRPTGPFKLEAKFRKGPKAARRIAKRWKLNRRHSRIFLECRDLPAAFLWLVRICYLTPLTAKFLSISLFLQNLKGRFGLMWLRRHKKYLDRRQNGKDTMKTPFLHKGIFK